MEYSKVTAIIPELALDDVEQALIDVGVEGMTVCHSRGFGAYRNFFADDAMSDCARVEVFTPASHAETVAQAIGGGVDGGLHGGGMVAISPVVTLRYLRDFHAPVSDGAWHA